MSLNLLSTFAFLLVLGIVVDDAIVVGESIHHHASAWLGGEDAAVAGAFAVSRPVIFAVLTTIVAFAPGCLFRVSLRNSRGSCRW
ncbi:MAG: hypothetical protein CM15mP103_07760 [Gammaproteobacteria bacterium]|nr:MAG: hypothetical protein CM15mP103_07760 [Gammaproteobacteria bacterium]